MSRTARAVCALRPPLWVPPWSPVRGAPLGRRDRRPLGDAQRGRAAERGQNPRAPLTRTGRAFNLSPGPTLGNTHPMAWRTVKSPT
jgi:hypothetical protein